MGSDWMARANRVLREKTSANSLSNESAGKGPALKPAVVHDHKWLHLIYWGQ